VVPAAVLTQVWPLLALLGVLVTLALAQAVASGDRVLLDWAVGLFLLAAVGLAGAFALHEAAHVAVLRRAPGVTHIAVERTWLRLSVVPVGELTAGRAAVGAAAGPLSCVGVGALLWSCGAPTAWVWCYLAHGVMLLPVFGDGRVLLRSIRSAQAERRGGRRPDRRQSRLATVSSTAESSTASSE
jgi:hypothetical protein